MNIADRSLALVDLALRRRFAFATLKPRIDRAWHRWVTEQLGIDTDAANDIRGRMAALNEAIARSLGEQFCVGHSYVTPADRLDPDAVESWFRDVVETELAPLLEEYWFDDRDRARQERDRLLDELVKPKLQHNSRCRPGERHSASQRLAAHALRIGPLPDAGHGPT